jgi:hypothetical protein
MPTDRSLMEQFEKWKCVSYVLYLIEMAMSSSIIVEAILDVKMAGSTALSCW